VCIVCYIRWDVYPRSDSRNVTCWQPTDGYTDGTTIKQPKPSRTVLGMVHRGYLFRLPMPPMVQSKVQRCAGLWYMTTYMRQSKAGAGSRRNVSSSNTNSGSTNISGRKRVDWFKSSLAMVVHTHRAAAAWVQCLWWQQGLEPHRWHSQKGLRQ
jgi:hypothetical protein